jgi:hypothetical protein
MTSYIVNVFATSSQTIGKGKRQRIKVTGYGYQGWNTNAYLVYREHGRLEGSGSFVYPGFIRAQQAARAYLALPGTHQVAIATNSSEPVYRYFKSADGRITGYADSKEF